MFSQWRSKRHFPMDSVSSAYPTSQRSQPTTPVESDFAQNHVRSMQHPPASTRATGVKALGRVGIGKGAKFRPGTRDGSSGTRSPMSFAAGPRSTSRGANSLEYGGGVIPDDWHSEADRSDSSASPVTPQCITSSDAKAGTATVNRTAHSASPSRANAAQHQRDGSHLRLESIATLGSFEDFRSLIDFSTSSHLLDESPALTMSTDYSSPDVPSAAIAAKDKPLPAAALDKPQPPLPTSAQPQATASANQYASTILHPMRTPPKRVAIKTGSASADEPVHLRPQSIGFQRRSTASSLPESVSQPGSSQMASEEFHSPGRRTSTTADAMRRLEDSVREGSASAATFGLGITAPEDAQPASTTTAATTTATNRTSAAALRNSISSTNRRHTKSSSDMSGHSSADSWGRTSFGRDALRMLIDSDHHGEPQKPASLASSKTQKTYISDSGHSTNTAETSADVHDSDQLSTIKERTESPESMLKRQLSIDSGFSQSQPADFSDARTSRTSASSARSEAFRTGSPESRFTTRTHAALQSLARAETHGSTDREPKPPLSAQSQSAVNGIGSPTFGFRQPRKTSQSSAATELLPPLDLDAPDARVHVRTASNASSTYSRTAPSELSTIAGLRRGSAGIVSTTSTPRLAAETFTAPLPSLPFPASSSTPLLQPHFAWSAAQSSEPNTPNLTYEAALAKAVGKQRKNRPAALALNTTALSAFSPNGKTAAMLSPNHLSMKGLASPGKPRVPPPSAPPTEPLPPIPNTPSLAPKSPHPQQQGGSWTSGAAGDEAADPLRTPKGQGIGVGAQDRRGSQTSQNRSSGSSVAVSHNSASARKRHASGADTVPQTEAKAEASGAAADEEGTAHPTEPASLVIASPTVASMDESLDGATTFAVAQTATRIPAQPVRLSLGKKETNRKDESKDAASSIAPVEAGEAASSAPVTALPAAVPTDQAPLPSPVAGGQIVSFDVEPSRVSQSLPRRILPVEKPSRPPPSAWNTRKTASVAAHGEPTAPVANITPTDAATKARSEMGHERDGAASAASHHSALSTLSDRRREILQDKHTHVLGDATARDELLKRTEGRFAGAFTEVAAAFRQLQADKLLLEQIVRERTPLSGVGTNHADLAQYLSSTRAKLEHSHAEIHKLLALLEQQREVMEQLLATQQLERETYHDDVDRLHAEAEHQRSAVVRLNAELAQAHAQIVHANAEAMRARAMLGDEARKRDKVVALLREAKQRLREVETENLAPAHGESGRGGRASAADDDDQDAHGDGQVAMLRRLLEERDAELAALRLSHADAVMRDTTTTTTTTASGVVADDDASSSADVSFDSAADEIARLRTRLAEQKQREHHIRSAYVLVREELRKANSERRRCSSSSTSTPASAAASPLHVRARFALHQDSRLTLANPAAASAGAPASAATPASAQEDTPTPWKLKRLSLPIVARAHGMVAAEGGGAASAGPPSAFARSGGVGVGSPSDGERVRGMHARRHSRQIVVQRSPSASGS